MPNEGKDKTLTGTYSKRTVQPFKNSVSENN